MTSAEDVAQFMMEELNLGKGVLEQAVAVLKIRRKFGSEFLYQNKNGNFAIDPKVLSVFERYGGDGVVWSLRERLWRWRRNGDRPGRQQD